MLSSARLMALSHVTEVYPSFLLNPFSDDFLLDLVFCAASVSVLSGSLGTCNWRRGHGS